MPLRWPFGKSRAVGKAAVADAAVEVAERRDGGDAVAPVSVLNPSAPVIARSIIQQHSVGPEPVGGTVQAPAVVPSSMVPMSRSLRLLTLGSCRLHDPIRAVSRAVGIPFEIDALQLANTHYFHTVPTNLQFLEVLCGTAAVKQAALPLIFLEGKYTAPKPAQDALAGGRQTWFNTIDAILLEVCEQVELISGELFLDTNEVHRYLVAGGGPSAISWWAAVTGGRSAKPLLEAALAEGKVRGKLVPSEVIEILENIRVHETQPDDIAAGLTKLRAFAGKPVFVVSHINCLGNDGKRIARRQAFTETVRQGAVSAGIPHFSPETLIAEFGQERVLAQQGRDSHHYDKAFLEVAGRKMFEFAAHHLGRPIVGGDARSSLPDVVLAKPEAMPIRFTVAPAIASLPSAVVPVIEILESQMVSVLTDRLKALGEIESGLGAYYAGRVRSQKAFGDDDRMLLEVLASDYLSYDGIVEIGAGYGQLGLALGVRGRQVICVETDRKRFACMEALKAGLEQTYPAIAQNVSLRFGTWPALLKGEDPSGSLLVAVDFVYTGSGDIEAAAIAELKRHGGAIIDASHFVHSRLTPETRDGFYQSLRSRGFVEPKPLAPHKNSRNSAFVFVKAG